MKLKYNFLVSDKCFDFFENESLFMLVALLANIMDAVCLQWLKLSEEKKLHIVLITAFHYFLFRSEENEKQRVAFVCPSCPSEQVAASLMQTQEHDNRKPGSTGG